MDVISTYKRARVSARKARDVAREIQGLPVSAALDILNFTPRKAAEIFGKTLKTALADAENNFELSLDTLIVKEATVGEGPTYKRFKPRARGSASAIRKRTSHFRIVLTDEVPAGKEKSEPKPKAKKKAVAKKAATKKEAPKKADKKKEAKSEAKVPAGMRVDEKLGLVYDSAPDEIDDLKGISGVGPVLEKKLHGFGIYTFDQVVKWEKANIVEFDDLLDLKGRIERDEWLIKARDLHKAKYGK